MYLVVALDGAKEAYIDDDVAYLIYDKEAEYLFKAITKASSLKAIGDAYESITGRQLYIRVNVN